MKTIEATVQKQNLVITPSVLSVAESVNAYALKITYDAEWADVDTKIITFKGPSGRAYPIPDNGEENGVVIPWEVLRCPGKVYVGVIGYKGSVQKLVTTGIYERNTFVVLPAAFGLSEAITPTPDVYQKIVQTIELMQGEIGDLADLTTEAKNNLVAAINEIAEGGGATGTVKSVNNVEPDTSGNVQLSAGDVGAQSALNTAQLAAVNSGIDSTKVSQIATNETDIDAIEAKIPSAATSANQLADKDFVNNQVSTNTANYISDNGEPFESVAALEAYTGTVTNNDYAFVEVIESGNTYYDRYKATVTGSTVTWAKEYRINNSSFTSGQWDAINSGITSSGVAKLVDFTGTDGTSAGSTGLVPAPTTGDAGKVLGASGNWETPSSGPTVVQTTGTSTTDVMSQDATTKIVFSDGSAQQKIRIGSGASVTQSSAIAIGVNALASNVDAYGSIAIGGSAKAPGRGAIAIGEGSNATAQGQFDISTNNTYRGYNSSTYRLLTGLYDPQSAHDAANKEYVDAISIRSAGAPTTSTTGAVGQLYQDTTNGKLYQCTAANTSSTPAVYTWQEIGGGGGAITYLSQDDYNWNYNTLTTTDPNAIALWLLEPGLYALRSNDPSDNVIYVSSGTGGGAEGNNDTVYMVTSFPLYNGTYGDWEIKTVTSLRGYSLTQNMYDYNDTVEDGWANRGQELFASMSMVDNEINGRIRRETYAPTEDDYGNVGTMWSMTDPSDPQVAKIYICTQSYWDDVQGKLVMTWVEVAAHSS